MTSTRKTKDKYIFPNLLVSRFNVSTTDKLWSVDDTKIKFSDSPSQLSILFIIDLASRKVIKFLLTKQDFNSSHIKRAVKNLIVSRNIPSQKEKTNRLIIHTDRDTHFCSKTWLSLQQEYQDKIICSMSEQASPKQNAVSERFHRTIKNVTIDTTIKEYQNKNLVNVLKETKSNTFSTKELKNIVQLYVNHYNNNAIHRTLQSTPNFYDTACNETRNLIGEPHVIAVRNNETSPIEDRIAVSEYKKQIFYLFQEAQDLLNDNQLSDQNKLILKKAQQIVQNENKKLATLTQAQFSVVTDQLEEIQTTLDNIKESKKRKKNSSILLPLRDPILADTFLQILNAPLFSKRSQEIVSYAQFKIAFLVLYLSGARVNEIRYLRKEDFDSLEQTKRLPIHQTKTHNARFAYLGPEALTLMKQVELELETIFSVYKLKFLGASLKDKENVMAHTSWIRSINRTLSKIKKDYGVDLFITSHSLRIGYVTRMLSRMGIKEVSELVGHRSLQTTQRYSRYLLTGDKARKLSDSALFVDQNNLDG